MQKTWRNSCIVYESKTKDLHGHGRSNFNVGLFVNLVKFLNIQLFAIFIVA